MTTTIRRPLLRHAGAVLLAAATLAPWLPAQARDEIVGVSWSNFQEERWKKDEAAIKAALAAAGARYIAADAQGSNEKQLADIEALIAKGAKALIILAMDANAILPRRGQGQGGEDSGGGLRPADPGPRRAVPDL